MSERTALSRARTLVLAALTVQFLVLLGTGVILFFTYRPAGATAYGDLFGEEARSSVDLARATTAVHRWAARSAVLTAVVAGVLIAVEKRPRAGRRLGVLLGPGLPVLMVVGWFTGYLLRWDQLGLWAVTVGTDMRGYRPLFDDDQIRFVIVGGAQIAPGTIVRWLLFHMLVVGATLAALLTIAWGRSMRPDGRAPESPAEDSSTAPAPDAAADTFATANPEGPGQR